MKENIATIKGFSCYEILDNGKVRYKDTGKICLDFSDGNKYSKKSGRYRGYRKIKIYDENGNRKRFSVHRLVWTAFFGEIPQGYEIDHVNSIRTIIVLIICALYQ